MSGKASAEIRRKASAEYYARNRAEIRAKRNDAARLNPRVKDRTTPKERARQKVRYAVWSGKLTKPDQCQSCGATGVLHGHHDDYEKPLDVRWLCAPCHAAVHAQERRVS